MHHAGGGNEKPGANIAPPAGAVPSFSVQDLSELASRLKAAADAPQASSSSESPDSAKGAVVLGWPARLAAGDAVLSAGAPPAGLDFLIYLQDQGALNAANASFPNMGAAAGGLATCARRGDRVLHVFCGGGGLTKLMASQGMKVGMQYAVCTVR